MAIEHRVHIGASYLEVSGDDFFNTFALVEPDGTVTGRVRKESLPGFEGWYFSSRPGPKVIATDIGRIGVGICYDNYTARFFDQLRRSDVDLLLMPHSGACIGVGWFDDLFRDSLREIPRFYSRAFGIPTMMVNEASVADSPSPIPSRLARRRRRNRRRSAPCRVHRVGGPRPAAEGQFVPEAVLYAADSGYLQIRRLAPLIVQFAGSNEPPKHVPSPGRYS